MEINDEKRMVILDEEGNEHTVEILFTYEHEERGKKYVFFFEESNPDEVFAMRYTDEGELEDIDDEEEYNEILEVFNAYQDDPEIAKLKNEA